MPSRVTRAMTTTDAGAPREFVLVEARNDVSRVIRSVETDKAFERRPISGLPVWLRPDFALARVGPRTLAVGSGPEVEQLARVRLGIKPDLKTAGQLFDRFQDLNQGSAIRLVSRDPSTLAGLFQPIFPPELLDASELLGLSLNLQNPVKARLFLKMKSAQDATEMAARIRNEPQRWLRVAGFRSPALCPGAGSRGARDGSRGALRCSGEERSIAPAAHREGRDDPRDCGELIQSGRRSCLITLIREDPRVS